MTEQTVEEKTIPNLAPREGICATINDIHDWICSAKKGDTAIYFTGELAETRTLYNPAADFVWAQMRRGVVALVQKKGPRIKRQLAHNYFYMMQRTGVSL